MALPIKTTDDDVRKIVAYFKTKASGATVTEARSAVRQPLVDGRKMSAYQFWGILTKDGDKYLGGTRLRADRGAEFVGGGLTSPAPLISHQVSMGTAASQKSSLRPVDSLTTPRNSRNSSSDGSVGVPP
jgi:hypothetical protein